MAKVVARYPVVDFLKAVAAMLIALHHFAVYGPVSDALQQTLPSVSNWLYNYGRMAVQVFLVVGGYLAASGLAPTPGIVRAPLVAIGNRYLRLLGPLLAALALTTLCAALTRPWLHGGLAPLPPTWDQWLAHVGLLQGILGYDAMSAGVWYVAIDFQLFALLSLWLWFGRGVSTLALAGVALLCTASLLVFNRNPALDNWAVYFFGAYGLGNLAWWARRNKATPRAKLFWVIAAMMGILALAVDMRMRIGLALGTALLLSNWGHAAWRLPPLVGRVVHQWSQTSYALFLVHFPILLLVNAAFVACNLNNPITGAAFLVAGMGISQACAFLFFYFIETPLGRLRWGNRD